MNKIVRSIRLKVGDFIVQIRFFEPGIEMKREYSKKMLQFIALLEKYYTLVPFSDLNPHAVINIFDLSLHNTAIIHKTVNKTASSVYVHLYSRNRMTFGTSYTISHSQFRFILLKIFIELLAVNKCFLLHASSIKVNNEVHLFTGNSGAGKSTIVRLLTPEFTPFSDELILVKKLSSSYVAGQSFFREKNRFIMPDTNFYPIKSVYFIHQSEKTYLKSMTNKNTMVKKLAQQLRTDIHNGSIQFTEIAQFVDSFSSFYDLFFEKKRGKVVALVKHHNTHPAANSIRDRQENNYKK